MPRRGANGGARINLDDNDSDLAARTTTLRRSTRAFSSVTNASRASGEDSLRESTPTEESEVTSPDYLQDSDGSGINDNDGDIATAKKKSRAKNTKAASKPSKRPRKVADEEAQPAEAISQKPVQRKRKAKEVKSDSEPDSDAVIERPPAVNDEYRPIPFKGRLGFACLNTYLRNCNPPIFCSRTCRLDTILKHDKDSGAGAGLTYVKSLGFANATDLSTLIRWNQKYNIRFLRISSEMFPFASHATYGYTLEHAAEPLQRAGQLAMQYGHRLTMHPGQFTQLGSPRTEVVDNAIRDLDYQCELLDRLQLHGQADRDAVMIIHMGGIFGDKKATLDRFKSVYTTQISDKLGIPLVLDWHHNNIIPGSLREGTYDVKKMYGEAIKKTWTDKGITQKQHYSEPTVGAVTGRDRRKHSPRVADLPPCEDTMDLMIEAKDKEQAVFALMKKFKMDGWERIGDVVPHVRDDENEAVAKKGKAKAGKEETVVLASVPPEEIGMGGADNRVFWPEGMEDYLRPKKKVREKKDKNEGATESVKVVTRTSPKKGKATKEATAKKATPKKTSKTATVQAVDDGSGGGEPFANGCVIESPTAPPASKNRRTPGKTHARSDEEVAIDASGNDMPSRPKRGRKVSNGAAKAVPAESGDGAPATKRRKSAKKKA
ncbi:hypothetical protein DRE_05220 [Drechslerella stenobrocha 248]|uniref:UV-damage endonuclease n=1 Tax=Drechslerella stenobrocha 248 TaxID=1043628 RepID=W7HR46_9PEZI|nr:hypothetical protein DRE_05220 [Drechslerella stenobrocha 248]